MAIDIVFHLLRTLSQAGLLLDEGHVHTLLGVYRRSAEDLITTYYADAAINRLKYDRHSEEGIVEVFLSVIRTASDRFLEDPIGAPDLPNWIRVMTAMPDVGYRLRRIIHEPNGVQHEEAMALVYRS